MDSSTSSTNLQEEEEEEVAHDFHMFRIYKDGRVERLRGEETIPPSTDPLTGVQSKDVVISPETNLSARLFLPANTTTTAKLPLLIYIHGGGFSIQSPFSPLYHNHLTSLVAAANVVAVSVHYRRAPEHPLPVAYDDAWAALKWAVSGSQSEPWLTSHADLQRVFLVGDSAGANIAHSVAMRAGIDGDQLGGGVQIAGMVSVHPFFCNDEPDKMIEFIFPSGAGGGCGDPRMKPAADLEKLAGLGCRRVLVLAAGKDWLRDRAWSYYEALRESRWGGEVEIVETEGEDHVFHLFEPNSDKAVALLKLVASFMNQDMACS